MTRIIKPHQPGQVIIPKRLIKERLDEAHRRDWEDPDRYQRQKAKALRYIAVRAKELVDVDRLLREVTRVFHDDLIRDPDVREAAQCAVHQEEQALAAAELPVPVVPNRSLTKEERGAPRGIDNLDDEKLEDLNWQRREGLTEP